MQDFARNRFTESVPRPIFSSRCEERRCRLKKIELLGAATGPALDRLLIELILRWGVRCRARRRAGTRAAKGENPTGGGDVERERCCRIRDWHRKLFAARETRRRKGRKPRYSYAVTPAYSLDTLNPKQQEAAQFGSGPLLIIAGAGTGKTNTLAHRVAHLVLSGARPERILLLTFTRRAALEMTRRTQRIWVRFQVPVPSSGSSSGSKFEVRTGSDNSELGTRRNRNRPEPGTKGGTWNRR